MAFEQNPYRRNAFDAFPLRKDETNLRTIRRIVRDAREAWKINAGKVIARDGTEWEVSEAQLNYLESMLSDPVSRLREEQFVHQPHHFSEDAEVARLVRQAAERQGSERLLAEVLEDLTAAVVARLARLLPELTPPVLDDGLPWPDLPDAFPIELEPLEQTLLRER